MTIIIYSFGKTKEPPPQKKTSTLIAMMMIIICRLIVQVIEDAVNCVDMMILGGHHDDAKAD